MALRTRIWLIVGTVVAVAVAVTAVVLTGAGNCPKGQHAVLVRYQPVVTVVNKTVIVEEIPIYACER